MLTALAFVGIFICIIGIILLIICAIELGSEYNSGKRRGINENQYAKYDNTNKSRSLAYAYDRGFKRGKKIKHKRENAKNWGEEYTKAHDERKAEADRIAKINGG